MTTLHLEIPIADEVVEKMGLPAVEEFFREKAEELTKQVTAAEEHPQTNPRYEFFKKFVGSAKYPDAKTDKYDVYDQ